MKSLDVGALPNCDGDRLVGMITDRDMIVRATAEGRDPKTTPAKEAMTPEVVYVYEDQDIEQAASVMQERQPRRLVVLDRNKRLVGILSWATSPRRQTTKSSRVRFLSASRSLPGRRMARDATPEPLFLRALRLALHKRRRDRA